MNTFSFTDDGQELRVRGISNEPFDTGFIKDAMTILGVGIHVLNEDLGTIEISQKGSEQIDIMYIHRIDGYYRGDPRPKSICFYDGSFELALIGGSYGFHRIYDINDRLKTAEYIKDLTIIATMEESARHLAMIKTTPDLHAEMWF
tara:strand:- start:156 stop:593 length:438 start_codon:yes stop_codon:yes gene_type:complete